MRSTQDPIRGLQRYIEEWGLAAEEDLKNWVLQLDEVKEAGAAVKADLPNLNDDATTAAETDAPTPAVTKTRTPARLQESTDTTAVPGSS